MEEVAIGAATTWVLVFCRHSPVWWVDRLPGRYKHVRAYAYLPPMRAWLFYDVSLSGTAIYAAPDGKEAEAYIGRFVRDADLVSVKPRLAARRRPRLGPFTCVSATAHLIGLRTGALRPDRLYRDVLAAGGEPLARRSAPTAGVCPARA